MISNDAPTSQIKRNKTAIRRLSCSRPIVMALADGLITKQTSVFDYGCGHGGDVGYLLARRVRAKGWDPHYRPKERIASADVVNLGYVLNVVEDKAERDETLGRAFALAKEILIVGVRVDGALEEAAEFGDGVVTRRGTFQKIYTQQEFREYLEATLNCRPQIAALGIAYVFKNQEAEARYLATRAFTRRLEYRTDLIADFVKSKLARHYVDLANRLGRLPLPEEFPQYDRLQESFGSPQRIARLTLRHIDFSTFSGSQAQRREDILTYLAMLRLQGLTPPPFYQLPPPVQGDMKAILKSYSAALTEGERYLFTLGNPEVVQKACASSPVGKLLPTHLYVHKSAEDELPALLRVVIFAAKQVIGEVPYNVVKIAVDGRTVSFLDYPRFDEDSHPALLRGVRVYLPKASFSIRDYSDSPNPPILHRKDAFVAQTYPHFEKFLQLTEQEEAEGLLSTGDIGFRVAWETLLRSRGLCIKDHQLHLVPVM